MASKKFYMVHWHKAKRAGLHWDLRLEYDGVLKSWAIPKGMPVHGGRHLAIKVTDHSLSYGKWEGTIKSGYGAGEVKIDTSGQYETLEKTKKSWKFKILSGKYKGTWRLTYWKEDKWLISKSGGGDSQSYSAEDNTQIAAQFNNSQMSHKCRGCGTVLRQDEMYSPDSPDDPDALIVCRECYMGHFAAESEEDEIPEDVQKWLDENNMVAVPDEEIVENFENANAMYEDLFEQINRQEQQAIIQAQQDKIDAEPVLIDTRTLRDRGFPNPHLRTQRWRTPEYDWPAKPKDLEYRSYSFAGSGKTYEDIEFRMGIFDEWGQNIGFETAYAPIRVRHSLYPVPRGKCARIDCEKSIRKGDLITWQGKGTQRHLSCWPRGVQAIVSEVLSRRHKPLMKAEEFWAETALIDEVFCNDCLWGGEVTELISARDKYGPYDGCPQCKSDNLQGTGPHSTKYAENITEKQFRDYARKNPKVANAVDTDDVKFLTKGVLLGAVGGILIGTLSTVFGNIWSEFWLDLHRKNGGEYQKGGES